MNFSELHERVRAEMLRRIENGSLNATLLARQIGCSAAHVSNFLKQRRRLSIDGLDKVLRAQFLTIADLSAENHPPILISFDSVPLVEPSIAASSIRIPSSSIIDLVKVRSGLLGKLRDKCSAERRKWDRFVAVHMWDQEADLMQPLLPGKAIVLIDRHYNSTIAYLPGKTTIYAVRLERRLHFRTVTLLDGQLVLLTRNPDRAPELIALSRIQSAAEIIVGRVFLTIVEH
jgi:Cro/C1-type HTH DNA-binding domain